MSYQMPDVDNGSMLIVNRRRFLTITAAFFGSSVVLSHAGSALAQNAETTANLQNLSEFLAAKPVDAVLASRSGSALTKIDGTFPKRAAALADFIAGNRITDVEALKIAPDFTGELKTTAQELLSALYAGFAGDPKPLSAVDNVEFITFTGALTYQLTHKYTPIPSYSRWQTNYWEHLPDGI